jgi:hypothetical protein
MAAAARNFEVRFTERGNLAGQGLAGHKAPEAEMPKDNRKGDDGPGLGVSAAALAKSAGQQIWRGKYNVFRNMKGYRDAGRFADAARKLRLTGKLDEAAEMEANLARSLAKTWEGQKYTELTRQLRKMADGPAKARLQGYADMLEKEVAGKYAGKGLNVKLSEHVDKMDETMGKAGKLAKIGTALGGVALAGSAYSVVKNVREGDTLGAAGYALNTAKNPVALKLAEKGLETGIKMGVVKGGGMVLGKTLLKKVPIVAGVAGAIFAYKRFQEGDKLGAALELTSGILGAFGLGAAGMAVDGVLIGRDLIKGTSTQNGQQLARMAQGAGTSDQPFEQRVISNAERRVGVITSAKSALNDARAFLAGGKPMEGLRVAA